MLSQIINYTGNGTTQSLRFKFEPKCVIVVPFGAQVPTIYHDGSWSDRAVPFGAGESFIDGVRIFGQHVEIGRAAAVNTSAATYVMVALAPESGDMDIPSWCGNGSSLSVKLNAGGVPVAALAKRDNALPLIIKTSAAVAMAADGTAVSDCIALSAGRINVTSEPAVNEWVPESAIGEGIAGLVFFDSAVKVGTYAGTGSARLVPLGCTAAMVLVWRLTASSALRMIVRGFGVLKTADANAATPDASLDDGFLALGTSLNSVGATYAYIAIPHREPATSGTYSHPAAPGRKMLRFAGRGNIGYVDFGTGLNVSGQKTITWFGAVMGDPQGGVEFDGVMLLRASGAHGTTAGTASWGLLSVNRIDNNVPALKWGGPHIVGVINDRLNYAAPLDIACWRTGIIMPMGVHAHSLVIRADGTCEYWRDGVLLKQRRVPTDTFGSYANHRVTMGARWTGAAYSNNGRLGFIESHFCAAALSDDQIRAEHARLLSGSTDTPVLSACLAHWRAEDISGTTLPDLVGSNHGTIAGGSVVTL